MISLPVNLSATFLLCSRWNLPCSYRSPCRVKFPPSGPTSTPWNLADRRPQHFACGPGAADLGLRTSLGLAPTLFWVVFGFGLFFSLRAKGMGWACCRAPGIVRCSFFSSLGRLVTTLWGLIRLPWPGRLQDSFCRQPSGQNRHLEVAKATTP